MMAYIDAYWGCTSTPSGVWTQAGVGGGASPGGACGGAGYSQTFYKCFYPDSGSFTFFKMILGHPFESKTFGAPNRPGICAGNPIHSATGNKFQQEVDYAPANIGGLSIRRSYNSQSSDISLIGAGWTLDWQVYKITPVDIPSSPTVVRVSRPGAKAFVFNFTSGAWAPDVDVIDKLTQLPNSAGWQYVNGDDDSIETYDLTGRLLTVVRRSGLSFNLQYDSSSRLSTVTDSFGRVLTFNYGASTRISTILDSDGGVYTFGYGSSNTLASVSFPDGKTRTYLYEDTRFPTALTGVIDEDNVRFATWAYDAQGRGISSTHGAGLDSTTLTYNADGTTSVMDAFGTVRVRHFQIILDVVYCTGFDQPSGSGSSAASDNRSFDSNGNVSQYRDFNGNVTNYSYDLSRNLETSRTEAYGTPQARTITTTWHPTYRLPATLTEPTSVGNRVTTYSYDASGNALSKQVVVAGFTRVWSWTYDSYGRVLTATDPRGKTSTNSYYPNTAAQNTTLINSRGLLAGVTNAVNRTASITGYTPHGKPLPLVAANGLSTTLTYDARQRLTARSVGTETTGYSYDGVGQLTLVTLPDGSTLTYTYDGAHRLTQIADGLGNKVVYTLDNIGNRSAESYYDPANVLARTRSRVYDPLNRLYQDIGGADPAHQVTQYAYDSNGNMNSLTDPLARVTTQNYDALNRLLQVTDPVNGAAAPTKYAYDAQDNLTQVTDPKNLATVYAYNGFNELATQTSPDTGVTGFTYDSAGNLATKTDARNVTATYAYDDLNRVATISYPAYQSDPAETVTYTYDSCSNGIGRLCSLSDKTGSTSWSYDLRGRILSKAQTIAGLTQTLSYHYNAIGQMDTMTLPSGRIVSYSYLNNRVTGMTVNGIPVVKNADYEPFGPVGQWAWGNDTTGAPNKHIRSFDLDGRNTKIESGNTIDPALIVYDAASRITALQKLTANTVDPAKSNSYGYDNLDRLTTSTPNTGNPNQPRSYTYH